jgi:diketogulonate reductase-like aldo/keto reductase
LLAKPVVSSVIVGASKMHQLEDNLHSIHIKLSATQIQQLDAITKPGVLYPHWFNQQLVDPVHKEILHPAVQG